MQYTQYSKNLTIFKNISDRNFKKYIKKIKEDIYLPL